MDVEEVAVADTPTGALSGAAKASKNWSLVSGHNLKISVHIHNKYSHASYSTVGVHCEHY